jgi:hypothetical protein
LQARLGGCPVRGSEDLRRHIGRRLHCRVWRMPQRSAQVRVAGQVLWALCHRLATGAGR